RPFVLMPGVWTQSVWRSMRPQKRFSRGVSPPSMYTLRHQFGANLKASGMSRVEMAYVMGHQATDSIGRYGDKRYGRAEALKVRPAKGADLSKVRATHAGYAKPALRLCRRPAEREFIGR